jgi:hypothetical protein
MTSIASTTTTEPATRSAAAERMRLCRRQGLRGLTIELRETTDAAD